MAYSDIKIQCSDLCKNSPKKEMLKHLTIALAKKDIKYFLDGVTDTIIWNIVGNKHLSGKTSVEKFLNESTFKNIELLQIHNIITHGNAGTVNGTLFCKQKEMHFCHVYNFNGYSKNAKIKTITSYIIQK